MGWKMKLTRIDAYAFFIGAAVVAGWFAYSSAIKKSVPATDFFTVREINIPDFVEGSDPVVVYDRTIKRDFIGTFIVEIHKAETSANYAVCSNSAARNYKAGEKPPPTVTLKWFVDRDCGLSAGQYVAETTWKIEAEGYPAKEYSATSNVFRVLPEGAQLYVTPQQIEQLSKAQDLLNDPIPVLPTESSPP